ncbi:hypothetical protein B5X24_HaOG215370 [Helicoverpa armigera]|nr:hypothetical protein B5X24_HaOG215370 [Helicoverpa armigera]
MRECKYTFDRFNNKHASWLSEEFKLPKMESRPQPTSSEKRRDVKLKCYPLNLRVTENEAVVPLQDLLDHTIQSLAQVQSEVIKAAKALYSQCDGLLENSTMGVPLSNIVNYDESNLADDPGKRVFTKRAVKYPESVMNHTKSSTSLKLAASADGILLSCYVVYKATHLYNTWTTNGPPNCRYNRTSSGCFNGNTFEDFNSKTGKKILIGDNLSSHL